MDATAAAAMSGGGQGTGAGILGATAEPGDSQVAGKAAAPKAAKPAAKSKTEAGLSKAKVAVPAPGSCGFVAGQIIEVRGGDGSGGFVFSCIFTYM